MGKIIRGTILTLACLVAAMSSIGLVHADSFESAFHTIDSFRTEQTAKLVTLDADGDGAEDVVFTASVYGSSALFVLGRRADGSIGIKQNLALPRYEYASQLAAASTPAGNLVAVAAGQGLVRIYAGWPLAERLSFDAGDYVHSATFGDVDADGVLDLVLSAGNQLRTHVATTGQLIRAQPVSTGYTSLQLAQMDADPALEILAGGGLPGLIVDGATQGTEWSQPGSLGDYLSIASWTSEPARIAAVTGWNTFGLFGGLPWSETGSGSIPFARITALATARLDASDGGSVLVGDSQQGGGIRIFDAGSQLLRRTLPGIDGNIGGVASPGAVDVDGDGRREVAYLSEGGIRGTATIVDSQSGDLIKKHVAAGAPLTLTAIGDVDGDGRLELVAATWTTPPRPAESVIISDLLTGAEKWRAGAVPGSSFDPFALAAIRILLLPRTSGVGMDIVLAGSSTHGGHLTVFDGVSKTVTVSLGGYNPSSPAYGRNIKDIGLFDYNHDGVTDFVVVSTPGGSGSSGALLQVLSGVNASPLWTSVPMGTASERLNNVLVLNRGRGNADLVAVLSGSLRAYDARSGLLRWTWEIANDGVSLLANPDGDDELAIYRNDGTVAIHAAATRQFRRGFTLSAPLLGISALPGNRSRLLALHEDNLALVDGTTGALVASTESLGSIPQVAAPPAAYRVNDALWHVAVGSTTALYRKRLILDDPIFTGTFDSR